MFGLFWLFSSGYFFSQTILEYVYTIPKLIINDSSILEIEVICLCWFYGLMFCFIPSHSSYNDVDINFLVTSGLAVNAHVTLGSLLRHSATYC